MFLEALFGIDAEFACKAMKYFRYCFLTSRKNAIFAPMIQIETILDILWKGFIIGVIVSAPLGPVSATWSPR